MESGMRGFLFAGVCGRPTVAVSVLVSEDDICDRRMMVVFVGVDFTEPWGCGYGAGDAEGGAIFANFVGGCPCHSHFAFEGGVVWRRWIVVEWHAGVRDGGDE